MQLSVRAKGFIAAFLVVASLAFAVIVELGITAGRVHGGVSVNGFSIGGLTEIEALEELEAHALKLVDWPVVFTIDGFNDHFEPVDVGWGPQVSAVVGVAMRVGRDGAPFGALADRFRAWTSGVDIKWYGSVDAHRVGNLMDYWEEQLDALGYELKRKALRRRMKMGIVAWPPSERTLKFPVER